METDVLIVGAGPVGAQVARHFAISGVKVTMLEEHDEIGMPVQCSGLFTPAVFDMVPKSVQAVQLNRIRGAHIYSPSGVRLDVRAREVQAIACDRAAFDRACVKEAVDAGATITMGAKAVAAQRENGGVKVLVKGKGGETWVRTRLLVGADGVQSNVAKWFGLPRAVQLISCHGGIMDDVEVEDPESVEMWTGQMQAPNFFNWIVPDGKNAGKVEVGVFNAPLPAIHYWQRMFDDPQSGRLLKNAKLRQTISGVIPIGPVARSTTDNVMLVGDAAAQAKPTTGGGVYMGFRAARHLADVAVEALEDGDCSNAALKRYHDLWMGDVGRELKLGMWFRRAFMGLNDKQMDELFSILSEKEMLMLVNSLGDIDYPSKVIFEMFRRRPQLLKFAPSVVKSFFLN
ncbi:MAG: NAD(P)/FAD-dependent oxidoreductase [Euryarchaeota archaeon]|nr:NAD(P)/FAD-dependent oxidoreductase [Euryarchaeota archaeon]